MDPRKEKNYLSKKAQNSFIVSFKKQVKPILTTYVETKKDDVVSDLSMDALEEKLLQKQKVSKKQVVTTFLEQFDHTTLACLKMLDDPAEESKDDEVEPVEMKVAALDNQLLLTYFSDIKALLTTGNTLLAVIDKGKFLGCTTLIPHFTAMIAKCSVMTTYLAEAIDISIYKVVMPENDYNEMYAASESFHFEGRTKATAKATAGLIGAPLCAVGGIFATVVAFGGMVAGGGGGAEGALIEGTIRGTGAAGKYAKKAIGHYGFSCTSSIPANWIEGTVSQDGTIVLSNPQFAPGDSKNKTIYVLDANNPANVLKEGITYLNLGDMLANPSGRVIFFHNLKHAFQCADLRKDGKYFDEAGGWRRYHEWTVEERNEMYRGTTVKTVVKASTLLPQPLIEIVGDYLGYATTPNLKR